LQQLLDTLGMIPEEAFQASCSLLRMPLVTMRDGPSKCSQLFDIDLSLAGVMICAYTSVTIRSGRRTLVLNEPITTETPAGSGMP
jgi:hypothetical protein